MATLPAGDRSNDHKCLGAADDRIRKWSVRQFVRYITFAGEEPQKRSSLAGYLIADRSAKHRIGGLQFVKDRLTGNEPGDVEHDLVMDTSQRSQMRGKEDPDHGRVWTSTETTAGRSWTMAVQVSPASADAYT